MHSCFKIYRGDLHVLICTTPWYFPPCDARQSVDAVTAFLVIMSLVNTSTRHRNFTEFTWQYCSGHTAQFPRDFFQERGGLVLICRQKEHRCILIFLARLVAFRSVRNTFPFNSRMLSVLNPPFTSQFVSLFPSRSTLIPNPKKMPCFNDNVTDLGLGICRGKSLPYTLNSEIQR